MEDKALRHYYENCVKPSALHRHLARHDPALQKELDELDAMCIKVEEMYGWKKECQKIVGGS